MAKHILKYKLHGGETPWYIEQPGIYLIDGWYYGVSRDDDDCYIPGEIQKITKAQLKALLMTKIIESPDGNLTDEQKNENVERRVKL